MNLFHRFMVRPLRRLFPPLAVHSKPNSDNAAYKWLLFATAIDPVELPGNDSGSRLDDSKTEKFVVAQEKTTDRS